MVAGEKFSDMVTAFNLEDLDGGLELIEKEMSVYGYVDIDRVEVEARAAMEESGATFAVVFQNGKLFGYVSRDKLQTFEAL